MSQISNVKICSTCNDPVSVEVCSPAAIQGLLLREVCATVDGIATEVIPVAMFDPNTLGFLNPAYLDNMGNPVIGVVTVADPCDCDCLDCTAAALRACTLMQGFDTVPESNLGIADPTTFVLTVDAVLFGTVVHDYLTTTDGVNKSTWYTPLIAAINSIPGWTITLSTDALITGNAKPIWEVACTLLAPSQLIIDQGGGQSILTLDSDGLGNMIGAFNWGGSDPFSACP